jgi:aldehyde dehydrogenase (NAD(P)+)
MPSARRAEEGMVDTGQLDQVLEKLAEHKTVWARLPIKDKIQYLVEVREATLANAQRWADAETKAKQLRVGSPLIGAEAWLGGPYGVVAWLSASIQTLTALDTGADLLAQVKLHSSVDGKLVARVLPHDIYETLLLNGITADVWMREGVTEQNLRENMASFYRRQDPEGELGLVLGAGNVSAIVPLDILDRMINCGEVVICKMNPVNDYLGPIFEDIFAQLVRDGYLAFAYGGGDVGEYLTRHDAVQAIHITGSAHTHDLIVYGPGEEGQRRKAADDRIIDKPINSELGGVGATVVLPGPWSDADFRFQAEHVVTQKLHNAGHNCVASQVLILPADWDGSRRMLREIRRRLNGSEPRIAYYPGTEQRLRALQQAEPAAEMLGGEARRLFVADVDPAAEHYGFRTEFFAPAMVTTSLPGGAGHFLQRAVDFCNDALYGTLSVNLIVHPKTRRELGADFEQAIAALHYGGIGINAWVGAAFLIPRAAWGAYPGHSYTDVQSGIGVVHNALMFDKPLKTVVSAPFHPFPRSIRNGGNTLFPKPPWFLTNKTSESTARKLTEFAAAPSAAKLPALFTSALGG